MPRNFSAFEAVHPSFLPRWIRTHLPILATDTFIAEASDSIRTHLSKRPELFDQTDGNFPHFVGRLYKEIHFFAYERYSQAVSDRIADLASHKQEPGRPFLAIAS
jgi:hypothetical protein